PLDFTDPLPDDRRGRLDVVQAASVGPQELGLVSDGQSALLHRLDGPPGIIAVVVIDVRGPRQDVFVELREARRRGLITLKAGDAVLAEGLAGQALQGGVMKKRVIPLPGIDPVFVPLACEVPRPFSSSLVQRVQGFFCTKRAPVWWKRLPELFVSP